MMSRANIQPMRGDVVAVFSESGELTRTTAAPVPRFVPPADESLRRGQGFDSPSAPRSARRAA